MTLPSDKDLIKARLTVIELASRLFNCSWFLMNGTSNACVYCESSDAVNVHSEESAYCYSCQTAFDVFTMIGLYMKLDTKKKCDFPKIIEKAKELAGVSGTTSGHIIANRAELRTKQIQKKKEEAKKASLRIEKALNIFKESRESKDDISRYFTIGRKLKLVAFPENVLWHERDKSVVIPFIDADGLFHGCQKTFLTSQYRNKRASRKGNERRVYGYKCDTCLLELYKADDRTLYVFEGLEKAIAGRSLFGAKNIASAYSSGALKKSAPYILNKGYKSVFICADHDSAGLESAKVLYVELAKKGIEVQIYTTGIEGIDFDDLEEARV